MSKVITIAALTCFLIVGAAATSILARDSVPAAAAMSSSMSSAHPAANRAGKADRLHLASIAPAPVEPAAAAEPDAPSADVTASLRQAFAAATANDIPAPIATAPDASAAAANPAPKPKVAVKSQKSYSLLSDVQIAGIRERLRLSSSQESYWPAVESALRNVARRIQANRLSNPNAGGMPIDPDSQEIQELKSAAMPLLFQLRDDQKEEVRKLARIIGLEKVAQQI
ncbi:MAG: hypothetical protein HY852_06555 [Bradyrhizobium sp.]|uniref:hypothetical protein n=1 Tax=Bradyrhizobium sp. TaxID=376 RepID=UPI0025B9B679|nr:hypothetical protein [Bradyrhizobium sp.]MBI5261463.1 hypothetical protein [Bradyrhizobium sp.]